MPLTFEKRARAALPAGSDRQQTYLFHPRYRQTTRARMVGVHFICRCKTRLAAVCSAALRSGLAVMAITS
jgi:hypothetical protein